MFEKSIETFHDKRAKRFFDLFEFLEGQVTVSIVMPEKFSGWHKHLKQTDYFCVVQGNLQVFMVDGLGNLIINQLSASNPRVIEIPPGYLHAWRSLENTAVLIYYLSRKHDESDEFRLSTLEVRSHLSDQHLGAFDDLFR